MTIYGPLQGQYDYDLGIGSDAIDYIKESHEIQSRISGTPCYLLVQNPTGSSVGSLVSPITISTYIETSPNYRAVIWPSGSNHPDLRPYVNNGIGAINVFIDSVQSTRVLSIDDLVNNNEFAVVKRKDLNPARVELVFNTNFNASLHTITYYFNTMQSGIIHERAKSGEDSTETFFGWTQYLRATSDAYRGVNQILVRLPLTVQDLIVNEEGLVKLEQNQSWMIWDPYVHDYDILVILAEDTPINEELRYEITDKQDSMIQGTFVSQRFKLRLIEKSDPRYSIGVSII